MEELKETILEFYNELAKDYHLIFHDWNKAISRQSEVLNKIILSKKETLLNPTM